MTQLAKIEKKTTSSRVLTPQERVPPGYYVALNEDKENNIREGILVLVRRVYACNDAKTKWYVEFSDGDRAWYEDVDEFERSYRPEPNGAAIRQKQILALMGEIEDLSLEVPTVHEHLTALNPRIGESGQLEAIIPTSAIEAQEETPIDENNANVSSLETFAYSTTDVSTTKVEGNAIVKKAVALMRNSALKLRNSLTAKQSVLRAYMDEKKTLLKVKFDELNKLVKNAEKAIWTINLYLGKDEQIHRLAKGISASKEEPITIRQKVLYMDEECAELADTGGLDAQNIEVFDEWLTADPSNINRIAPDQKCVVAIKPRKKGKKYQDPWVQEAMDEANNQTYFLIRNGENIYRIFLDFNTGADLVPDCDDLFNVFYETDHDWKMNRVPKNILKPGSDEYMDAMNGASGRRQHYFRVILILQGLIDRTTILHPLPAPGISILDPNISKQYLKIVFDNQLHTAITDGRPDFWKWLKSANETIGIGQRIIGYFSYSSFKSDYKDCDRIFPPRADMPKSNNLYVLEKRSDDNKGFFFYYDRGEVFKGYGKDGRWIGYGQSEVRARCVVYRNDEFILNYDAVSTEEIEYYLNSRLNRQHYADMFPLLTRALEFKRREAEDEKPFQYLLVGQFMLKYGIERETAEEAVPELVKWWKFKNQTHRALLSNDVNAIKMIIDEYGIRQKRSVERLSISDDKLVNDLVDKIIKEYPSTVLIAHKKGNEYVALVAHNDENVFVNEQLWSINRSSNCAWDQRLKLKEQKRWNTIDTRCDRWHAIYKSDRFNEWIRDSRKTGYLIDPEREQAVQEGMQQIKGFINKWSSSGIKINGSLFTFFTALLSHSKELDEISFYLCDMEAIIPTEKFITNHPKEPSIAHWVINWKRNKDGIKFSAKDSGHRCINLSEPFWDSTEKTFYGESKVLKILWRDDDAIKKIEKQQNLAKLAEKRWRSFVNASSDIIDCLNKQMLSILEKRAYDEFIAEYGDPELWNDHLKTLKIYYRTPDTIRTMCNILLDRLIDLNGMTVQEIVDMAWPIMQTKKDDDEEEDDKPMKEKPKFDDILLVLKVKHDKLITDLVKEAPEPESDQEWVDE